ncbi:MAG: sterol desaturase family protein [Phormidesmis sp. RL_2_1]|nr:sterol desaturase family protein [Phormidesmis sp. RL_2_1]
MTFSLFVKDLCHHSLVFFAITVAGYVAAAGSLYWALYYRRSSRFTAATTASISGRSLQDIWRSIRSDVGLSVLSSAIFSICAALMTGAYTLGFTKIYLQPERYGLGYLAVSLCLILIAQDTYFYFIHRLSHHPKCYKWLHQGHHHSKNPTPWTSFAFDPAEAMVQSIYLMGVVLLIPIHISVLVAVVMIMTMGALLHHFGVRLFDDSVLGKWLGSWLIGSTHHWLHHRKYTVHYSLYFTFWDKLMGTQYKGYEDALTPSVELFVLSSANSSETLEAAAAAEATEKVAEKVAEKTLPFPLPLEKAS